MMQRICVYCGSSPGIDSVYSRAAEQLAEVLDRTLQDIMAPLILESPLEKLPLTRTELQIAKLIQNQYTKRPAYSAVENTGLHHGRQVPMVGQRFLRPGY